MADDTAPAPMECMKCGATKYRSPRGKLYCKACANRATREWRIANKAEVNARQRARHAENRERDNKRSRAYYLAHRAEATRLSREWQRANPELRREIKRRWNQKNKHKGREYAQRRRALILAAVCKHGAECVSAEVFAAIAGQMCVYCFAPAEHADHYIPLSRGGLHCRENIVPACDHCNKSKNNLMPDEWRARLAS